MTISKFIIQLKRFVLKAMGRYKHLKVTLKCKSTWYGNEYGGFYVCSEFIDSQSIVYSFGIGEDVSFDEDVMAKHHCEVWGFDPTPKSIHWVLAQTLSPSFHFYPFGISHVSGRVDFFLPNNPDHVSGSLVTQHNVDVLNKVNVEMKKLSDITHLLGHTHIDVLKIDIEGSEYEVIMDVLESNITINQILIELHDRFFMDGKEKTKKLIKQMNDKGYEIFAVSKSFEEISFINKKLVCR